MTQQANSKTNVIFIIDESGSMECSRKGWSVNVNIGPTEAVTLTSMEKTVEELRKTYPEMGECLHHELITSQYILPPNQGTRYMCTRCFKMIVVPAHMLITRKSKEQKLCN